VEANNAPPGRKKLAYTAEKMCKEDPALAHLMGDITEHSLRKFLQSQTKSGEITLSQTISLLYKCAVECAFLEG
jgi:hypothetical protein